MAYEGGHEEKVPIRPADDGASEGAADERDAMVLTSMIDPAISSRVWDWGM